MNMKMRPMSEAPLGVRLLIIRASGEHASISMLDDRVRADWSQTPGVLGFYKISDLLRAAEILAAITPEGYEYEAAGDVEPDTQAKHVWRRVAFCHIAPPVEYEYVTDGVKRTPRVGDWLPQLDHWIEVKAIGPSALAELCFRRVEVKR